MAESEHYQQLGKFVVLFQELEDSLIELNSEIADEDYAAGILPAETEYPRLVESTDVIFSHFADRMRQPDLEAKTRFHKLMKECLDIGVLRNTLIRSTYALLIRTGNFVAPVQRKATLKFKDDSPRQAFGADQPVESFEPYFQRIAGVLAEVESFRRRVIEWKNSDA